MKKVIYTTGAFDIYHPGHIRLLKRAKKFGDYLVVGLSTDKFIESYKGKKPFNCYNYRKEVLESNRSVDKVIKQETRDKLGNMIKVNADTIVMGDDWKKKGGIMGKENILKMGKAIVYIPYTKGISSTIIKERIKNETT